MCQSLLQNLGKLDISRKLQENFSPADSIAKSMGFSSAMNPATEIKAKLDGTKTKQTLAAEKDGLKIATANRDANYRTLVGGQASGHVQAIESRAARKAIGG
jgi:hypothetical protein